MFIEFSRVWKFLDLEFLFVRLHFRDQFYDRENREMTTREIEYKGSLQRDLYKRCKNEFLHIQ